MTTRPDPNTFEAPQEATEGRLSTLEGENGNVEASEGPNGPQAGADGFQADRQPRGPVDWARHYADQRAQGGLPSATTITQQQFDTLHERLDAYRESRRRWMDAAFKDRRIALAASDTIARVRDLAAELFVTGGTETERAVGRRILSTIAEPASGDAGPSVAECAKADRAWPLEKAGE